MSNPTAPTLKCVNCGRVIEACACCDELECPPPTCDRCLTEAILRTMRSQYLSRGASMSEDRPVASSAP
jgi:hypothetical protein